MATTKLSIFSALVLYLAFTSLFASQNDINDFESKIDHIVTGFSSHDPRPFNQSIDAERIIDSVLSGMILSPEWERGFRNGLTIAITTKLGAKLVSQIPAEGYAKLLRIKQEDNQAKALIRLDYGEKGNGYMDMHLVKNKNGKIQIIDWFDYSSGQLYTESVRQLTATLSPTPTVLGKIFDFTTNRKVKMDAVMEIIQMSKNGQHKNVVNKFLSLDETLRKSRILNIIAIQEANKSSDMDLYRKALANLDRYYGNDPSMAFLLLDYYFFKGKYERAIELVEQLESSIGVEDAGLIGFKANAYFSQGKYQEAIIQSKHAIEIEPAYEMSYFFLINSQISLENFKEATATAKILEQKFGYDMSPASLNDNEAFKDLAKSNEYKQWRSRL